MEEEAAYLVETTPEADYYFFQICNYLEQHHEQERAELKADELLRLAESLDKNPYRGTQESRLAF